MTRTITVIYPVAPADRSTPDFDADWWLGRTVLLDGRWQRVTEVCGYRLQLAGGRVLSMGLANEWVETGRLRVH